MLRCKLYSVCESRPIHRDVSFYHFKWLHLRHSVCKPSNTEQCLNTGCAAASWRPSF
jgi:hypothetical protein